MVRVNIKWGKESFSNVELDISQPAIVFKAQLFALTGVPVERQKLMSKAWKGILQDDANFSTMKITDGLQLMLMGTAETIAEPVVKVKFIEDMNAEEQALSGAVLPSGFQNLGNTCYMNSTLQCLRYVPELREALRRYRAQNSSSDLAKALGETFEQIDQSQDPLPPFQFLYLLRAQFPQFAQRGQKGEYMQQDAEELFVSIAQLLSNTLREPHGLPDLGNATNLFDALFGFQVEETLTCEECKDEPPVLKYNQIRNLVCNIQGGAGSSEQINHMHEGIRLGLFGSIEKNSEILGRNALWKVSQKLDRLPRYICVQFMRFFWKATPESRDHTGVKCKIMKPVTFPQIFDVYEFCSDRLKSVLQKNRITLDEEKKNELKQDNTEEKQDDTEEKQDDTEKKHDDGQMQTDEEEKQLQEAIALSRLETNTSIGPGLPLNFQGNYEVFGVVTHKGREADAGHYVGWVRQEGDNWLTFDDDRVSECKTEDVMRLKGGGDWHMAYLCFYRFKN